MHQRSGTTRRRWGAIGAAGALFGLFALATAVAGGPASADVGDGTITITVIRDVNANSNYDPTLEVGVAGIRVTVTDDAGTQLSADTDATGTVVFNPATDAPTLVGGRYRVEATIPTTMPYLQPAQVAGGNLSPLTDFVDVSGGVNAALTMGVINPADYVGPNPGLVTAYQWPSGPPPPTTPPASPLINDPRSLVSFPYTARGDVTDPIVEAEQIDTGTVYGIAHQRTTGAIFSGAYAKRLTAYGPGGQGAIYRTDPVTNTTTLWGTVPDPGTTAHGATFGSQEEFNFWGAVGTEALGDLDLSEDGTRLFVVNLNDRQLYEFDATTPTMGAPLSVTPIPDPGCADPDDWRPFGLGVRDHRLYVGGVCSAESSGDRADLKAAVWTFDIPPSSSPTSPTLTYVQNDMTFLRGAVAPNPGNTDVSTHWNAWVPTYNTTVPGQFDIATNGLNDVVRRPMPILSDIAIEADGSLVLGFRDRLGDLMGAAEPAPRGPGTLDTVMTGGDLNRVCLIGGTYTWEGTGGCPNNHVLPSESGQDPTVEEYYPGEYFWPGGSHQETSQGAIALPLSEPRMAVNSLDPGVHVSAGGVGFYDRTTGGMWTPTSANAYELFADGRGTAGQTEYSFAKGNGLADLEIIAALAPVEIGNYVWFDVDRDGVQDPGEDPVAGVTVELLDAAGGLVGTAVTDASGNYYFGGSGNVNMIGGLPLLANTSYVVRIPNATGGAQQVPLTGWVPTVQDSGAATDTTDSDGGVVGTSSQVAIITGGPGFNNHTYDFGFYVPVYDLALRKTLAAGQPAVVNPGDLVTFTITVFNQGTNAVTNATVVDYIPAGMTLEDPDWTAGAGNTATTVLPGTLAAGASTTVDISLRLSPDPFDGPKDNHAEIASFTDEWGGSRDDEDSTPDDVFGNDPLVDDEVNNGGGDEDDEDIASISVVTPPPPTTTTTTVAPTSPPQPPPPPTTAMPNPGELPATGGSSSGLVTLAVLLVLGGAGVLMLARIRRRPAR